MRSFGFHPDVKQFAAHLIELVERDVTHVYSNKTGKRRVRACVRLSVCG